MILMSRILSVLLILVVIFTTVTSAQEPIKFWSTATGETSRNAQSTVVNAFNESQSNFTVEIEFVSAVDILTRMSLNQTADVMYFPAEWNGVLHEQNLIDAVAATQVVSDLGVDTFTESCLPCWGRFMFENSPLDRVYASVPSDASGLLLLYRTDLFEAAGLEPPTDFQSILDAAGALHIPESQLGIVLPSTYGDGYMSQVFENFALANGVMLGTGEEGVEPLSIYLDSPEMIDAISFYQDLMQFSEFGINYSAGLNKYVNGQAAMIFAPPSALLDVTNAGLAQQTGIVTAIRRDENSDYVTWGHMNVLGISPNAADGTQDFVRYWLDDAYLQLLDISKLPVRHSTSSNDDIWAMWGEQTQLSDSYSTEAIQLIADGVDYYDQLGFGHDQDSIAKNILDNQIIVSEVSQVLLGNLTAEDAAYEIQNNASQICEDLEYC